MPLEGSGPGAKVETLSFERALHVCLEANQGAITYSRKTRHSNDIVTSNSNRTVRGRSPGNIGPTSARHDPLFPTRFVPTCATAHPLARDPRRPRRAPEGPPLLDGFPPAHETSSVSGGDGLEVRRLARGIEMLANALLFRIVTAARFSMCSRSHDASSLRRVFHEREIALGDLPL